MTDAEDEQRKLEEISEVVRETKRIAPKLIEKGRNLTEAGQIALDWADGLETLTKSAPDGFFGAPIYEDLLRASRTFNNMAEQQYRRITDDGHLISVIVSNVTTTAVSTSMSSEEYVGQNAAEMPGMRPLVTLVKRISSASAVAQSMRALGLDTVHPGNLSAVHCLLSAEEALKRPFTDERYVTAVLLPLRESIEATVAELVRRRPTQEKISGGWKEKIRSIAHHCGHSSLPPEQVELVAVTTHTLVDELSGGKRQQMPRDRIGEKFDQGVSLLRDIVALVDPTKLRP